MHHASFKMGMEFMTATGKWRVTDVGSRTVLAIKIEELGSNASWYYGPPYAVVEIPFDELDFDGCHPCQVVIENETRALERLHNPDHDPNLNPG